MRICMACTTSRVKGLRRDTARRQLGSSAARSALGRVAVAEQRRKAEATHLRLSEAKSYTQATPEVMQGRQVGFSPLHLARSVPEQISCGTSDQRSGETAHSFYMLRKRWRSSSACGDPGRR